jgi:hypothetical protein
MKLHLDFASTVNRRKNWLFAVEMNWTTNFHAAKSNMNFTISN